MLADSRSQQFGAYFEGHGFSKHVNSRRSRKLGLFEKVHEISLSMCCDSQIFLRSQLYSTHKPHSVTRSGPDKAPTLAQFHHGTCISCVATRPITVPSGSQPHARTMMKLLLTAFAADDVALTAGDAAIRVVLAWVALFFGVSLAGVFLLSIRWRLPWMRKLSLVPCRIHWKKQLPQLLSSSNIRQSNGNHHQSLIPSSATRQQPAPAELVLFQRMMTSLWKESRLLFLSGRDEPVTMVVERSCNAADDAWLSARLDDEGSSRSPPLDETMESETTLDDEDDGEEAEIVFDHPDCYNDNEVHHNKNTMTCESSCSSLSIFANPFSEQYCPNYEQCFQGETDEDEDDEDEDEDDDEYNTPPALQVTRKGETSSSSSSQDGSRLEQQRHRPADGRKTSTRKRLPRVESSSSSSSVHHTKENGGSELLLLLEQSVPPCRYSRHDLPPSL